MRVAVAVVYPSSPIGYSERLDVIGLHPDAVWDTARRIVGGFIEILHLTELADNPDSRPFSQGWHLAAYVNEDGIAQRLPAACKVTTDLGHEHALFGPVVIVRERIDGDGDTHYADLTETDVAWILKHVRLLVPLGKAEKAHG